jgi:GTP-binding protein
MTGDTNRGFSLACLGVALLGIDTRSDYTGRHGGQQGEQVGARRAQIQRVHDLDFSSEERRDCTLCALFDQRPRSVIGTGIGPPMQAKFIKSAAGADGFPDDAGSEVAFVGRSNSGKSSAINRIVAHGKLARVSKTPGRTQLINFFDLENQRRLVDLPGYGFAKVPDRVKQQWRGLIEAYFESRRSLAGLFMTVDIRRGLSVSDEALVEWAAGLDCPVAILLTKADKLSRGAGTSKALETQRAVGDDTEVIRFSAVDATGVGPAKDRMLDWLGQG